MNRIDEEKTSTAQRAKTRARILKTARVSHSWAGTFFAPAILFFAFTGALQTFGLHEGRPGDSHRPAAWITKLAQLHKKQNLDIRPPDQFAPKRMETPRKENRQPEPRYPPAVIAFKLFTAFMSGGLILTTLVGLFMAFQFARNKLIPLALLAAGAVLPLIMIVAM